MRSHVDIKLRFSKPNAKVDQFTDCIAHGCIDGRFPTLCGLIPRRLETNQYAWRNGDYRDRVNCKRCLAKMKSEN